METTEIQRTPQNSLRYNIDIRNEKVNALIKIRLNDECKNGHQDFSITATFWKPERQRTDQNCIAAGCCHEEILKIRPDLKIFVNLHLCDYTGVPMHCVANGFYHLTKGLGKTPIDSPNFKDEYCEYYRIKPVQFNILSQSENELRFAVNLEKLGILEQWKEEADQAIKLLEDWTGYTFLVDSVKRQYVAPTAEEIAEEDAKTEQGYYLPENIIARKLKAEQEAEQKKYDDIAKKRDKRIKKAELEYLVEKAVLDGGLPLNNFIFYDHKNEGCFNWKDYEAKITNAQFVEFLKTVSLDGITWTLKNK